MAKEKNNSPWGDIASDISTDNKAASKKKFSGSTWGNVAREISNSTVEAPISFDPEGDEYDYETAKRYGIKPDETGHWQSRVPETGQILKGKKHATFYKTEEGERQAGYEIQKGSDGKYYSKLKKNHSDNKSIFDTIIDSVSEKRVTEEKKPVQQTKTIINSPITAEDQNKLPWNQKNIPSPVSPEKRSRYGTVGAMLPDYLASAIDEQIKSTGINLNKKPEDSIKEGFGGITKPELLQTPGGRMVGALGQGILSIPEGLAGIGQYLNIPGSDSVADNISEWNKAIAPDDPNFAEQLSSGIGSMLVFLPFGLGVGKAAKLMTKVSPKIANLIGMSGASLLESATESGSVYREKLQETNDESEASRSAEKTFLANMILVNLTNKFGVFGENANQLKKLLLSTPLEGLQEGGQEIISSVSQGKEINWNNVITSAGIGSIIGAGASVVETTPKQTEIRKPEMTENEILIDQLVRQSLTHNNSTKKDYYRSSETPKSQPPPVKQNNINVLGELQKPEKWESNNDADLRSNSGLPISEAQYFANDQELRKQEEINKRNDEIKKIQEDKLTAKIDNNEINELSRQFNNARRKRNLFDEEKFLELSGRITNPEVKQKIERLTEEIKLSNQKIKQNSELSLESIARKLFNTRDLNSLSADQQQKVLSEYNNLKKQGAKNFSEPLMITPVLKNREVQEPIFQKKGSSLEKSNPLNYNEFSENFKERLKYYVQNNSNMYQKGTEDFELFEKQKQVFIDNDGSIKDSGKENKVDSLSPWAKVSMELQGAEPDDLLSSLDSSNFENLKNIEPFVNEIQKVDPELAEKVKSGEASGEDIKSFVQKLPNPNPSEAQKEAGNYKKGHIKKDGLDISIENLKGGKRTGTDPDGNKWEVTMNNDYGYIKGTKGKDKDHLDVFLAEDYQENAPVFIVNQVKPDGSFDEHKIMLGFNNRLRALSDYQDNYEDGKARYSEIVEMPLNEFKKWSKDTKFTKKPAISHTETRPSDNKGQVPEIKKPYEINRMDYINNELGSSNALTEEAKNYHKIQAGSQHKKAVFEAISNGDIVPEEVLKDYPGIIDKVKDNKERLIKLEEEKAQQLEKQKILNQEKELKADEDIKQRKENAHNRLINTPLSALIKESGYKTNTRGVHDLIREDQKTAIVKALKDGKEVPQEVLKDYPEIIKVSPKKVSELPIEELRNEFDYFSKKIDRIRKDKLKSNTPEYNAPETLLSEKDFIRFNEVKDALNKKESELAKEQVKINREKRLEEQNNRSNDSDNKVETIAPEIKNLPLAEIKTDESRFQNRALSYAPRTVKSIVDNYNPAKFDPIVVWKDPENNNTYVLSGHSRLEGLKRRKADKIPVRYFEGSEIEATEFARLESNRSASKEDLIEDIKAFKFAKEQNYPKKQLEELFPNGQYKALEDLSLLDENGLFLQNLNSENKSAFPYLERNARWVGQLKAEYPELTAHHEDEIFDYFYREKDKNLKIKKDDFFNAVERQVHRADFTKDQALLLDNANKSTGLRARSDTKDLQAEIDQLVERKKEAITDKERDAIDQKIQKLRTSIQNIVDNQLFFLEDRKKYGVDKIFRKNRIDNQLELLFQKEDHQLDEKLLNKVKRFLESDIPVGVIAERTGLPRDLIEGISQKDLTIRDINRQIKEKLKARLSVKSGISMQVPEFYGRENADDLTKLKDYKKHLQLTIPELEKAWFKFHDLEYNAKDNDIKGFNLLDYSKPLAIKELRKNYEYYGDYPAVRLIDAKLELYRTEQAIIKQQHLIKKDTALKGQQDIFSGTPDELFNNNPIESEIRVKTSKDKSRWTLFEKVGKLRRDIFERGEIFGSREKQNETKTRIQKELEKSKESSSNYSTDSIRFKPENEAGVVIPKRTVPSEVRSVLKQWREQGHVNYVGTQLGDNPIQDIADLFYVARDPFTETYWVIGRDDSNKIVANIAVSSNASNYIYLDSTIRDAIGAELKAKGATKATALHNHPSGNPTPSEADLECTAVLKKAWKKLGINLDSGVVINGDRYSGWKLDDKESMKAYSIYQYKSPKTHPLDKFYKEFDAFPKIQVDSNNGPMYFSQLKYGDGNIGVVVISSDNQVRGYEYIHKNLLEDKESFQSYIDHTMASHAGSSVILVGNQGDIVLPEKIVETESEDLYEAVKKKTISSDYSHHPYTATIVYNKGKALQVIEYRSEDLIPNPGERVFELNAAYGNLPNAEEIELFERQQYSKADIPKLRFDKYLPNMGTPKEYKTIDLWQEELHKNISAFLSNFVKRIPYEDYYHYKRRALNEKPELKENVERLSKDLLEAFKKQKKEDSIISGTRREADTTKNRNRRIQGEQLSLSLQKKTSYGSANEPAQSYTPTESDIYKQHLKIGAEIFDAGNKNFYDWEFEMLKKDKAANPYLRRLYNDIIRRGVKDESKNKNNPDLFGRASTMTNDKKTLLIEKIADRLISNNLNPEMQKKLLAFAEKYIIDNRKFRLSKDLQGRFLTQFKEKVGVMARQYGAAGGELAQRMAKGSIYQGQFLEKHYETINEIEELLKGKNIFEKGAIFEKVIDALENRAEAQNVLSNDETAEKIYSLAEKMFDAVKEELVAAGYPVRENYFTHIHDATIIEEILSDLKDPLKVDIRNLNQFISSDSRFLKPRKANSKEIRRDLVGVMKTYIQSIGKALSYKEGVDYYYTDFKRDIPKRLENRSSSLAIEFMRSILSPEITSGWLYRGLLGTRNAMYRNFLAFNLRASAQNHLQKNFANLYISKEAKKLANKFFYTHKQITGNLQRAVAETKAETPKYLEITEGDVNKKSPFGKALEKLEKVEPFQAMEKTNWSYAELAGVINNLVKRPEYQKLKAEGLNPDAIFNKLLEDEQVYSEAVTEGTDLAANTQVSPTAAFRPSFYDKPFIRILGMFTRFKFTQLQHLAQTLGKTGGIEGVRAQRILRRGFSDNIEPVEALREVELNRKAIEKLFNETEKFSYGLGVSKEDVKQYLDYLKQQESELNNIIKKLEPLTGAKPAIVSHWAKYYMKLAALSLLFQAFYDLLESATRNLFGSEKDSKTTTGKFILRTMFDLSPLPFYSFNPSNFLSPPIIPNIDPFLFGEFNERGLVKGISQYGLNIVPGLGLVDRVLSRTISNELTDLIAPKKSDSSSRSGHGGRGSDRGR